MDDWRDRANCVGCDPAAFFPEKGESLAEAKAVCKGCQVRAECLEVGLYEKWGVWAGLTERERRVIRRQRRLDSA